MIESSIQPQLSGDDQKFLKDLEFLQNLTNIRYLQHLALNRYFDDPNFIEYLKYLRYFKQPQYSMFVYYPECYDFLDALIEKPSFRENLLNDHFVDFAIQQQTNQAFLTQSPK